MKKTITIFLVLMMIITALTGCGGNQTQTENNNQQTENNANQAQEETNSNENTGVSGVGNQTTENAEMKVLEDIPLSEERSGKAWKYDLGTDGSKITMSAGYTTDTDYVYDITFCVEINKNNSVYEEFKNDLTNYESQLKALNDDEIFVNLRETDDGIEFAALFDGLEYASRERRIAMAEEIIGVTANDADITFRFSEIDSELKTIGFVYGS